MEGDCGSQCVLESTRMELMVLECLVRNVRFSRFPNAKERIGFSALIVCSCAFSQCDTYTTTLC